MDPDVFAIFDEVADRSAAEREQYYASHRVTGELRSEVESLLCCDGISDDFLRHSGSANADVRFENDSELTELSGEAAKAWLARAEALLQLGLQSSPPAHTHVDEPGSWFGSYRLRELLGEGGMGVVWLAEQEQPIRRTVAIKVVKPGADSEYVLSRFGSERQALAILNHPHIAKVLDAGATANGRPYFVMEYVAGRPITAFADQHRLTITQRLELFLQVC